MDWFVRFIYNKMAILAVKLVHHGLVFADENGELAQSAGLTWNSGTSKLSVPGDAQAVAWYTGDSATNGSWRRIQSGSDLVDQRLESGVWVTKQTITP
jgi:hypothetical protein